ncbi:MAG: phosphoenolpyruvate--protein phosphotransferase [Kiritimatiellia bacterium]|jgi:phosphotransferase system enzyme I (PtsI)|nr:phosphoenolpyruvate--protein phosphotransferase [Kiritimatiellia bacterium]MDP6809420.1 phosphoenolpyruvate--protein phosphotransferase [Kiritimatiellia bacterium]MDP7023903.1 phosphoenolpyruvate--protein phosphotransferase [Kiritimatiellia bacterium]
MGESEQGNRLKSHARGIGVSPGVVIGPVFILTSQAVTVVERTLQPEQIDHEIARLEDALIATRGQLKSIQADLEKQAGGRNASILDAHLLVLDDRAFVEEIIKKTRADCCNVEVAVGEVAESYAGMLAALKDDYLRERVADVRDVARRVIRNLTGDIDTALGSLTQKHIVVANDLAPSDTATLRKDVVSGFATDLGSPTSHTAVMARALEIPAVVALRDITQRVQTGDVVLMDGNKGVLIVNPTPEELAEYGALAEARKSIERGLDKLLDEPAETSDGHRITLSANIEHPDELPAVKQHGAEGVGLFRSEYLFIFRGEAVDEDEQAVAYTKLTIALYPDPVIIRTLDLGGDKFFRDGLGQEEANPFLGCRSIRLSLQYPKQFKSQMRAILRASAVGNVKMMYPMISNVDEVLQANELLAEAKRELRDAKVPFQEDIDVGVMVEVPSAALAADALAEHVSFFSLGTNDLIQYTIAVDRVNERVAYLYEPTHPAVLKLIKMAVDAGHAKGIWVGVCGQMAADPVLAPLLVGMGVDELSVAPQAVPLVKDAVRSVSYAQSRQLAETVLQCRSGTEALRHCREMVREAAPEVLELI